MTILRRGDHSTNVARWQGFLNSQGFKDVLADAHFGPKTEAATKGFQKMCVVSESGIVDDDTIAQAMARGFAGFINAPVTAPARMTISQRGRDFIAGYEKLRLKVYDDGYGFPTVGTGHRTNLPLNTVITRQQALEFFEQDLAKHAEPVDRLVKVPLTQGQYDALVSLVFNIGEGNFASSTLLRELNKGNYAKACEHFADFKRSAGKVSRGLVARRAKEQAMFRGE